MLSEVRVEPAGATLTLHGDLDLMTVDALRELLQRVIGDGAERVLVDLSDVPFVDVQSLSVLLAAADSLREEGRQLVVHGASAALRRVCALLNADDILLPSVPLPRTVLSARN